MGQERKTVRDPGDDRAFNQLILGQGLLLRMWQSAADTGTPPEERLTLDKLPEHIADCCCRIESQYQKRFRVEAAGTQYETAFGICPVGKKLREIPSIAATCQWRNRIELIEKWRSPIVGDLFLERPLLHPVSSEDGGRILGIRWISLPLARRGEASALSLHFDLLVSDATADFLDCLPALSFRRRQL